MRTHLSRRTKRGVAALEFALLLPLLLVLLSAPLYIGRVFWHYTVAQKAAHDAAQYLATIPEVEIRSSGLAPSALAVANDIATIEMADLSTGAAPPVVTVQCDGVTCDGLVIPTLVRVFIRMRIQDPFFGLGFVDNGFLITADAQVLYRGAQ